MAMGILETGPKLDWTRDNKIFDRYQIWKEKIQMIFSSALVDCNPIDGGRERPISSGFVLKNYWNLLEAEFKTKGNKLLSVIELWSQSKQGSKTLNEWLTYVYNLVELCDYGDSKDRIIRDVLIIGCNSDKAKDKIV